jgi:hypothetical protein
MMYKRNLRTKLDQTDLFKSIETCERDHLTNSHKQLLSALEYFGSRLVGS